MAVGALKKMTVGQVDESIANCLVIADSIYRTASAPSSFNVNGLTSTTATGLAARKA
jgi:hypothetical protein